mgnify:FL=1
MTKEKPRNMAASVRDRLRALAKEQREDFGLVLTRYGLERFLYRLSQSAHGGTFILKGAMLFQLWQGNPHRPTRDLDLLGHGDPDPERVASVFREVCDQAVADDGLTFHADTVQAEAMKEDEEYSGVRVKLQAKLAAARISIQIDVGFGDAVVPEPDDISYPTLLDFPAPQLKAYNRDTVVAEKFQAMVMLGIANSRMKDFYDLWTLANQFEFAGTTLSSAIQATFERRKTALPEKPPLALTAEFAEDDQKRTQWKAFIRKGKLDDAPETLSEVTQQLQAFLMPPVHAIVTGAEFDAKWTAGGWQ